MKKIAIILITLLLFGCSSVQTYDVDTSTYVAKNKDSRIKFIVLHYTALNDEKSLRVLTRDNVSVHYVVTTKDDDPIFSLVPDNERAWHAGKSSFDGRTNINDSSIGIEIVNFGYNTNLPFTPIEDNKMNFRPKDYYYEFTDAQIKKVAFLVTYLKEQYKVNDKYIVAHSDIAPQRKQDPGPYFPWKELYFKYGLGHWYDESDKRDIMSKNRFCTLSPLDIKKEFKKYGYDINDTDIWDDESRKVIYAFQLRFRPEKANGDIDSETYAIIKALNKKYSN